MTTLGWLFMLASVGFVWILTGWCYYRVLRRGEPRGEPSRRKARNRPSARTM